TPIREVDGRKIGAGRRGPVTEKLQKAYFALVSGKTEAHAEWRTLVKSAPKKGVTGMRKPP
ncbi:hypothetical protein KQ751_15890, partial [Listeria monocytogenes]|nr:hypothetical protein [Listeria monocytogenes]